MWFDSALSTNLNLITMQKIYYHILEYSDYGNVGHQGYYLTIEEAQKRVATLEDYFPNCYYQIESSNSKKEPNNTTV